jgi:hypothetical protein
VLKQIYTDDNSLVGFNMPNIQNISPQAICPNTNTITFNANSNVTPTGGVNLDVWYNEILDDLYQNQSGTWQLLTNRVNNAFYIPPVSNPSSCPIPATLVGVLVIDIFPNSTANLYGYISTAGLLGATNIPVYTGNNFLPNYGVPGANNSYILASDVLVGAPDRRFEFNISKLINDFPSAATFTMIIGGRDTIAQKLAGAYSLEQVSTLVMLGSPGTYIPSVTGGGSISSTSYTSAANMMTGADGTFGLGVGAPIVTAVYTVATNSLSFT